MRDGEVSVQDQPRDRSRAPEGKKIKIHIYTEKFLDWKEEDLRSAMKKQNQKPSSNFKSPPSSNKLSPSSSAANRKTRWESNNPPPSEKKQPDSNPKSSSSSKPSENPTPSALAFSTPTAASVGPLPPLPPPGPTAGPAFPLPDMGPPLPPAYGFHNLERRTIVLADGSVRSYFALPPDEFPPSRSPADLAGGPRDFRGPPESSLKRKYVEEEIERDRQRQHLHQYGNLNPNPNGYPSGPAADYRAGSGYFGGGPSSPYRLGMVDDPRPSKHVKVGGGGDFYGELPRRGVSDEEIRPKHLDVDPQALKRSFLRFAKLLNEGASQRKNFLEDGKSGPLPCLACGRASKEYEDVHGLVMHAYSSSNGDSWVEHLGFHKALCILMGWNFSRVPDNSKAYQSLPDDDAAANREDLIIWPPTIIVHNTNLGRKNGRMEGLGNKEMDNKLRDLGFAGGKSKSMYGKDGHMGVSVVKFANNQAGLKEAERLAEYFEMGHHGRKGWARAQASQRPDEDDEKNPHLFKIDEKTREKKRILYGYLGTVSDLDKVDFDMKKKAVIKSRRELDVSD